MIALNEPVEIVLMSQDEARRAVETIRTNLDSTRRLLLDLYNREGWRALGYSSWRDCAQAEFGQSVAYLYRQLSAAKIEQEMDSPIGEIPESHMREIAKSAPEDRPRVIERATELAGDGPRTAKHITQAANEIALPDLAPFGFTARVLLDGRIAIRSEGNGESQHTHAQLNDLIAFWRGYPAIPADLATNGVVWRYRQDKMYQVLRGDKIGQTGYTAAECLTNQRESMERSGQIGAPAPDLPDILLRLDAHGYAKVSAREKGMTTFYAFRDYRTQLDHGESGEIEVPEGELPIWLAELDASAAYAQAKQERFIDAQARADRLGYDVKRDGARFVLTPAGKQVPALVGTLDNLIKTIEGYERNAAKKAAAELSPLPSEDAQNRQTVEDMARVDLNTIGVPIDLHNAGYYWQSATPPTLAQNGSAWRGEAPTVDQALQLAYSRERQTSEPITVFPALSKAECKALIREAKGFIERGIGASYPTIAKALRIAARMALEATE
jgi:hypothetical protein